MNLLQSQDPSVMQSIIEDPFQKDKWTQVTFNIWNKGNFLNTEIKYKARVEFKNGNTSGKQEIEGTDFPDLLARVQAFMVTLP
jgi:hypothetical protein